MNFRLTMDKHFLAFSKKPLFLILGFLLGLSLFGTISILAYQNNQLKTPTTKIPPVLITPTTAIWPTIKTEDKQTSCQQNGGKWLPDYQECENISAETCASLSGTFKDCASACRHDPNAEVCIQVCVPICSF